MKNFLTGVVIIGAIILFFLAFGAVAVAVEAVMKFIYSILTSVWFYIIGIPIAICYCLAKSKDDNSHY